MSDFRETAWNTGSDLDFAFFCSAERSWINRVRKLATAHPDQIEITHQPEDNGGMLLCKLPKNWIKISPPRKCNLTDEQRQAAAERLRQYRETQ